jgi:CheY-like chemotaxis protein
MVPHECASGPEALELIRHSEPFDVAILDIQMPAMDGVALARAIREALDREALPLIALSSLGRREADVDSALFTAFLTKPVKQSQLYNVLIAAFSGRPATIQARPIDSEFDAGLGKRIPLRILIAEDMAVNQKLMLAMLNRLGYRADVAANGLEVLTALERQPYDLVLMDVQMPEMDGLEASRRIHQQWPAERRPRIAALTANAMTEDREACAAAGMDDYLSKPVQTAALHAAIVRCGESLQRRTLRSAPAPDSIYETGDGLDPARLAVLRQMRDGGVPNIIKDLLTLFRTDGLPLIQNIRLAADRGDLVKLKAAAHCLNGSAGNLGARHLASLCAALERKCREGVVDGIADLAAKLEPRFEQACMELEAELPSAPATKSPAHTS